MENVLIFVDLSLETWWYRLRPIWYFWEN